MSNKDHRIKKKDYGNDESQMDENVGDGDDNYDEEED